MTQTPLVRSTGRALAYGAGIAAGAYTLRQPRGCVTAMRGRPPAATPIRCWTVSCPRTRGGGTPHRLRECAAGLTARLLRAGLVSEVDLAHVAEEIEDMGKSERRELLSRLTVLLIHLVKWKWQPEKRSASWASTMDSQRAELRGIV